MRSLPSRTVLSSLIFRGNRAFIAYGSLYVQSKKATNSLLNRVGRAVPQSPKGVAFVRLGTLRRKSNRTAILIAGVGRFGNSIAQVLNSVELADALNAENILFHRFDAIDNATLPLGGGRHLRRVRFFPQRGMSAPHLIWRTYSITPEILFCEPWKESMSTARDSLKRATNMEFRDPKWSDPSQLAVYVRGGDVFDPEPEEHYGQPPWVFYRRVLEHKKWKSINLVSEDSRNPVVGKILEWCEERGVEVSRHGDTLDQAFEVLKSSTHIVNAKGTFVPAIVFLTGGPKIVYNFGSEVSRFFQSDGISVYSVEDLDGSYTTAILSANWSNTKEQQSLMLSYPQESVSPVTKVSKID